MNKTEKPTIGCSLHMKASASLEAEIMEELDQKETEEAKAALLEKIENDISDQRLSRRKGDGSQ